MQNTLIFIKTAIMEFITYSMSKFSAESSIAKWMLSTGPFPASIRNLINLFPESINIHTLIIHNLRNLVNNTIAQDWAALLRAPLRNPHNVKPNPIRRL